jgi:CCR4-NOT transcription complex subunit 6
LTNDAAQLTAAPDERCRHSSAVSSEDCECWWLGPSGKGAGSLPGGVRVEAFELTLLLPDAQTWMAAPSIIPGSLSLEPLGAVGGEQGLEDSAGMDLEQPDLSPVALGIAGGLSDLSSEADTFPADGVFAGLSGSGKAVRDAILAAKPRVGLSVGAALSGVGGLVDEQFDVDTLPDDIAAAATAVVVAATGDDDDADNVVDRRQRRLPVGDDAEEDSLTPRAVEDAEAVVEELAGDGSPPLAPRGAARLTRKGGMGSPSPEKGKMSARIPEPVEKCAVEPFVSVRTDDGRVLRGGDESISYKWFRSVAARPCAFTLCPLAGDLGHQSKLQSIEMPLHGTARAQFCSIECFRRGWNELRYRLGQDVRKASGDGGMDDSEEDSFVPTSRDAGSACLAASLSGVHSGSVTASIEELLPFILSESAGSRSTDELSGSERAFALAELARTRAPPPGPDSGGWEEIAEGRVIVPGDEDILKRLRVEVRASLGGSDLVRTAESRHVIPYPMPAPRRVWRPLLQDPATNTSTPPAPGVQKHGDRRAPQSMRVVSFNTLAEIYAHQGVYPYCPQWALSFDFRKKLLLKQLQEMDADVLCLQEVQADHFEHFFYPAMKASGYEGLYKQKNRDAMGVEGKVDGCALFFKTSRFYLIEKYSLDFNEAVRQCCDGEASKADGMMPVEAKAHLDRIKKAQRRLTRDNVAQVVILEMLTDPRGNKLPTSKRVCVANTHLFWDPDYGDVKLWQTHMLLHELEKNITIPQDLPLVLCGDFNSEPNSAVHQLLSGNLKAGRRIALSREQLPADPSNILSMRGAHLSHSLFLCSAYGTVLGAEPEFTNYTENYTGCLDYVWCSANHITPLAVLAVPSEGELRSGSGTPLPNPQYPSDHICLCADLLIGRPSIPSSMVPAVNAAAAQATGPRSVVGFGPGPAASSAVPSGRGGMVPPGGAILPSGTTGDMGSMAMRARSGPDGGMWYGSNPPGGMQGPFGPPPSSIGPSPQRGAPVPRIGADPRMLGMGAARDYLPGV